MHLYSGDGFLDESELQAALKASMEENGMKFADMEASAFL
jgi:hypothetical protein